MSSFELRLALTSRSWIAEFEHQSSENEEKKVRPGQLTSNEPNEALERGSNKQSEKSL